MWHHASDSAFPEFCFWIWNQKLVETNSGANRARPSGCKARKHVHLRFSILKQLTAALLMTWWLIHSSLSMWNCCIFQKCAVFMTTFEAFLKKHGTILTLFSAIPHLPTDGVECTASKMRRAKKPPHVGNMSGWNEPEWSLKRFSSCVSAAFCNIL